jgi:hypothetical protein
MTNYMTVGFEYNGKFYSANSTEFDTYRVTDDTDFDTMVDTEFYVDCKKTKEQNQLAFEKFIKAEVRKELAMTQVKFWRPAQSESEQKLMVF